MCLGGASSSVQGFRLRLMVRFKVSAKVLGFKTRLSCDEQISASHRKPDLSKQRPETTKLSEGLCP